MCKICEFEALMSSKASSGWIPRNERMPTRDDGNKTGQVFVLYDECVVAWAYWDRVSEMEMVTHWMRIPEAVAEQTLAAGGAEQ